MSPSAIFWLNMSKKEGGERESKRNDSLDILAQCPHPYTCSFRQFLESDFILRDKISHERQCSELHGASHSETSKLHGVSHNSILNELEYFHVCSGALLPDVVHDILEGALQYKVKLMLREMVYEEQFFTVDNLNSHIENLELGHMEVKIVQCKF